MANVLVVDDEQSMRDFLAILLKKEGHEVTLAENGAAALKAVQSEIFDLVISDVKMPGMSGIDLLKSIKEFSPETIVVLVTAFAAAESAVEAMKLGASDYIIKPFKVDELKLVVGNSLERRNLKKENLLLRQEIESRSGFENFIGKSAPMQRIFETIRRIADAGSTVLITGESGTGKELVARAVHRTSSRSKGPFLSINCGALPDTLLESELFGYMKGAFTGAGANKQGLFEAANGGSIFLDEISSTTPALQVKLLRVIQEREFMRVGGTSVIKTDARVIAASNKDIQAEVAAGRFREDLFYRLNVIPIRLPALRERRADIPLLVEHFLRKHTKTGKAPVILTPEAMQLLVGARWNGNVRELENVMERLSIVSGSGAMIRAEDVSDAVVTDVGAGAIGTEIPDEGLDLEALLESTEKAYLRKALEKASGVKTEAAKLLKMTFRSFRHRLDKYGE
jgi:two-component system response regulator PilR (NtrC family)